MKILHIIYSLSSGGAERFLVDLANELSQREDCDVRLLILKTDQDERNVFYKNELCIRVHLESLGIRKMSLSLFFKLYHFIKKKIQILYISIFLLLCYIVYFQLHSCVNLFILKRYIMRLPELIMEVKLNDY